MLLFPTGKQSCSELSCPLSFCNCPCHTDMSVMHCAPCCRVETCNKCGKTFDNVKANFERLRG